jgi:serine/threonine protein kinase
MPEGGGDDEEEDGVLEMELFDMNAQELFSPGHGYKPGDDDIARMIVHTAVAICALERCGIRHNDLFLRNILLRRRPEAQRGHLTMYSVTPEFSVMVHAGKFECVLADFGLASGADLPLSHTQRRGEFEMKHNAPLLYTHPLENADLSDKQMTRIDLLCLYISLIKTRAVRILPGLRSLMRAFQAQLSVNATTAETVCALLSHPYLQRVVVRDAIPHKCIQLYRIVHPHTNALSQSR